MHPAISVIFFTTFSGVGFGMMALLGLGPDVALLPAALMAFVLAVSGLVASTFHLGHPERAWRAFSQWRSSWLSREGVLAVVTVGLFATYIWLWLQGERLQWLGYVVTVFAALTVLATAMIYAQLRTVPHWHTALTPACYLMFSLASGAIALGMFGPPAIAPLLAVLLAAWIFKLLWWTRAGNRRLASAGASTGEATGLGSLGQVRLLEAPHSGPNYLTREMVHVVGRRRAVALRRIAVIFGLVLPAAVLGITAWLQLPPAVLAGALLPLLVGLLAERWLFFAEAEHAVAAYYR